MKCRLCLEDKNLLKKSHIIPNFLYSSLFDEKHRIHQVSIKNVQKLSDKILQSGEYDRYDTLTKEHNYYLIAYPTNNDKLYAS